MDKKIKFILCSVAAVLLTASIGAAVSGVLGDTPAAEVTPTDAPPPPPVISVSDISPSDIEASSTDIHAPDEHKPVSLSGTEAGSHIEEIAKKYECHSMAVAVIKDGRVTYNYEYGYADKKKTREIDSSTKYRIASLSKVFTSMLGMKLAEDGGVDLDGDVSDVMGFTIRNRYFTKTPITLRMLLSHSSSIRDHKDVLFSGNLQKELKDSRCQLMREPGTGFTYSNLGMGLAGAVIEKASGKTLSQYAKENFLDGMGIDAAYNGGLLGDKNVAECMLGLKLSRSLETLTNPPPDGEPGENYSDGAGGLMISAVDYAKIITILLNDGCCNGQRYLAPESVKALHEVQLRGAGYDQCIGVRFSPDVIDGREVYFHTGSAYGIFSLVVYDPADGSGVVIVSSGARDLVNDINIRLVSLKTAQAVYNDLLGTPQQTEQ